MGLIRSVYLQDGTGIRQGKGHILAHLQSLGWPSSETRILCRRTISLNIFEVVRLKEDSKVMKIRLNFNSIVYLVSKYD